MPYDFYNGYDPYEVAPVDVIEYEQSLATDSPRRTDELVKIADMCTTFWRKTECF